MHRLLSAVLAALVLAAPALAQTGANVLVVANEAHPDSVRIAEYYAHSRSVPADQVLRIKAEVADEIERAAFNTQIQAPIANWLRQHAAQDRILYIVLAKGVPLRVKGTPGRDGTAASVDSELTLLYQRLLGREPAVAGRIPNPYFLGAAPIAEAGPFSRAASELYLVVRLDGFTAADVVGLIDRGAAPSREGRFLLDQEAGPAESAGNRWLAAAAARLREAGLGDRVVLEPTGKALTGEKGVLGYFSWGSNDAAITKRRLDLGFVPGAIAGTFVSTDGRTFTEPPAGWTIGRWTDRAGFFAGSPQSLAGDLIREGVTGIAAHVDEPFLDATIRPDILFPAYAAGFNLAESFYLAMPYVSWRTVVVGDPLCAPFPRQAVPSSDIDAGLDSASGLPARFAERRLQVLTSAGTRPDAARAVLRAEALASGGDKAGARKALEEATALDATLVGAHLQLAGEYEAGQDTDKAIERYRLVLAEQAGNVLALNNLAYALAVRKGQAAEALPHAERAYRLSGGRSPEIADTYAWVLHLLGRDAEALPIQEQAARSASSSAMHRLHLSAIYAALGRVDEAAAELKEAVRLQPDLESGDEVKALRAKIGG
ncbi:MAG TPA: TIGR03790 family protein [Vicinamibacterales bacterium]|nr:TIGR03790 family protein [Vicinamibacterales bacterium]HOQ60042.1 TIGR03790 family protein [Vicinamibacterales bacterium]HPK71527.1 TIGR03790 family protein [Vicinamibacterales bacterium]